MLGQAIKLLREKKGLSARSLSISCGFSPSYVSKIESGEIEPSFFAFSKIAQSLEMTTQEIIFLVMNQ